MRVWVTGVGVVSSLGLSARETFDRLVRGDRGMSDIDLFDTSDQRARVGAQVRGVEVPRGYEWSRSSAFALMAAREAMAEASVDTRSARVGLVVGGTTAGMFEDELRVARILSGAEPRRPVPEMRSHPLSSTLDALSEAIGPFCRVRTVASACSSGASALWVALSWLAIDDSIDFVLAGGTDGLCRLTVTGFNALAAMDPEPCRPFDRSRRGMNLGEGAGFLVLERAGRRGASPVAELASVAVGAEAHHITNPEASGVKAGRVISRALRDARVEPALVDYVNAHGTGTKLNDSMEQKALAISLGEEVRRVPVSSSKGQIGHTLGAAGAIEAVISALALKSGLLPPTAGLVDVDPECDLVHLQSSRKVPRVRAVVSSSFGFGGMDAAVVLTEPELVPEAPVRRHRVVVTGASTLGPRGMKTTEDASSLTTGEQATGRVPDAAFALDPGRARRLDRAGKLATTVAQAALVDAGAVEREGFGIIMGSAYADVDGCAAFMLRIVEKGPRLASPADFPNLVPSSPIGHASIYLGLGGPAMATAELQASGESAIATAFEAVASGEADAIVAGVCPVAGTLIDDSFVPLFSDGRADAPRAEGAAAVVLESDTRGSRALAVIDHLEVTHGSMPSLPAPRDVLRARVVSAGAVPVWKDVLRVSAAKGTGDHESAGASGVVVGVSLIRSGEVDEVLVVGSRPGPGDAASEYFIILRRP